MRWYWPLADFFLDVWDDLTRDFSESIFGRLYRWLNPRGRHRA